MRMLTEYFNPELISSSPEIVTLSDFPLYVCVFIRFDYMVFFLFVDFEYVLGFLFRYVNGLYIVLINLDGLAVEVLIIIAMIFGRFISNRNR